METGAVHVCGLGNGTAHQKYAHCVQGLRILQALQFSIQLKLDSCDDVTMTQAQTMTYELMHMPMTLTLIQIIFINESSHKSSYYYSYSIIRFDSDSY